MDNAATTKVDDVVAEKVAEVMLTDFGNASSLHDVGKRAKVRLDEAREKIAGYLGCEAKEIVFTSGGTEGNNLAIRGAAKAHPEKKHIVTSVIEHPCVLETCKDLEKEGYEVDYVGVDSDGLVSVDEVREKIRDDTLLVSVMHVNNETGVIQPVEDIGMVCRKRSVLFHTDNVQGFLKEELALASVDLMSVSGHKVCGPKGVGFLYVRDGVKISPILTGGGQENGLRSGTENVPGVVGLAATVDVDFKLDEVQASRDLIIEGLQKIKGVKINGSLVERVYNNVNFSVYGIEGEALMLLLDEAGLYVSTGSACASKKLKGSYVLAAMGIDELYLHGSIRMSLGVDVIGHEVEIVSEIEKAVLKLREISPFKFEESPERDDSGEPEVNFNKIEKEDKNG
ncbi:cysteine desulfurase [Methanococcoides sp. SA1]|nr:cysteine desulfurase [Methanococcoides sp. SA1]